MLVMEGYLVCYYDAVLLVFIDQDRNIEKIVSVSHDYY